MQELRIAKAELLFLDDWGLMPLNDETRRGLLEILDDRHNQRSTLVTSQLPIDTWQSIEAALECLRSARGGLRQALFQTD